MTMSHLCLLGVATLTLTSASFAGSDTNADLQARLEAAEARISELSAQLTQIGLTMLVQTKFVASYMMFLLMQTHVQAFKDPVLLLGTTMASQLVPQMATGH